MCLRCNDIGSYEYYFSIMQTFDFPGDSNKDVQIFEYIIYNIYLYTLFRNTSKWCEECASVYFTVRN